MKTNAQLGLLALLLSILWAACTHDSDVPPKPTPKPDTTTVDTALLGKWYLLGSGWRYDMDPQPIDTVAYALEFWREGSLYGHYVNGSYTRKDTALQFKLNAEDGQHMPLRISTYRKTLEGVYRYTIYPDGRLRLYYDNSSKYLLFDRNEPAPPVLNQLPRALLTTWRLYLYRLPGEGITRDLSNSASIRFQFNADTTWVAQIPSAQVTGSFRTDSWYIHFSHALKVTDRFGSPDDRRLLEALTQVLWYELKENYLTLYFSGGEGFIRFQKAEPEVHRIDERLCQPWKLVGFGHTTDGSLRELTGTARLTNRAFLVEFQDDGSLYTLSSTNKFNGYYSVDGQSLRVNVGGGTKVGETKDGIAYVKALNAVERFELTKDGRLKLFYNQGHDYLLFREGLSLVSDVPPAELIGAWSLAEIRSYGMPPKVIPSGERMVDFRADGFVYITGMELFHGAPKGKQRFGYRPWGSDGLLFIGWMYFGYRIVDGELQMEYNAYLDGPIYVFKRL